MAAATSNVTSIGSLAPSAIRPRHRGSCPKSREATSSVTGERPTARGGSHRPPAPGCLCLVPARAGSRTVRGQSRLRRRRWGGLGAERLDFVSSEKRTRTVVPTALPRCSLGCSTRNEPARWSQTASDRGHPSAPRRARYDAYLQRVMEMLSGGGGPDRRRDRTGNSNDALTRTSTEAPGVAPRCASTRSTCRAAAILCAAVILRDHALAGGRAAAVELRAVARASVLDRTGRARGPARLDGGRAPEQLGRGDADARARPSHARLNPPTLRRLRAPAPGPRGRALHNLALSSRLLSWRRGVFRAVLAWRGSRSPRCRTSRACSKARWS